MRLDTLGWLLAIALLSWGCGGNKRQTMTDRLAKGEVTVDEVYRKAEAMFKEQKYQDARQWYRLIETHAPNSRYFSTAKLRIADTYFFDSMATYIEASVEYKSFLTHFPTHDKTDYAQYQYAMCFFTEIENPERDQTSTLTAYTEFKNVIDKFPNSPYAEKASGKIDLCLLRLAEHEFTVGYYYFRRGRGFEKSAESRLKGIIDNYPGRFDVIKTYFYLAETLWRLEKYKESFYYYDFLNRNHADSDYQPFVEDKLARWERIKAGELDPGELQSEGAVDPIRGQ